MNEALVTLIVPIYNCEKYVSKCLNSLLAQSYKNCEFVLVDDGSTDNSWDICLRFQESDRRFVAIHQDNQGVAAARNCGLELAQGDYIGFVDADDYIDVQMVEKMIIALLHYDADVVECSVNLVNEDFSIKSSQILVERQIEGNLEIVGQYAKQLNTLNYSCNKIFKASCIGNVRFPLKKASEDYFFNVLVLNQCRRMISLQDTLYNYVLHDQSATGQQFHIGRLDSITSGIEVFKLQQSNYPTLRSYYAAYILEKIITEYVRLNKSNLDTKLKKTISTDLIRHFSEFRPFVSKQVLSDMSLDFRWKHYILFQSLPWLYSRIF